MSKTKICLAIDLGAGSGRVVAGIWDGQLLNIEELNRFPNEPVKTADGWHWDLPGLFGHIKKGIALATRKYGDSVASAGVDTWGVDYGLLDAHGKLCGAPFAYRDSRAHAMMEKAFQRMPREEIYRRTGIQFMYFNTLFQLLAEKDLERAQRLLFMPDLIHFLLTGVAANERSIASTSQLLNPATQTWDRDLIREMGLPEKLFGGLVNAGAILGKLKSDIASETGAYQLQVITPACHDTASAVVGVPAEEPEPVFLSSGTWSLIGRELGGPVISAASFNAAFSNEGGVFGTTRFLKNIAGMWLLQECKRAWTAAGQDFTYDELTAAAAKSPPFVSLIDPDAADFQAPPDMPGAITEFCRRTGQPGPESVGAFARAIFESLALKYRLLKDSLARLTSRPVDKIHIVGGGSRNDLLNQFAADALDCTVVCGPVEATSIGNVIMQLCALGEMGSLAEGRAVIRRSVETKTFQPRNSRAWDDAFGRFQKILSQGRV